MHVRCCTFVLLLSFESQTNSCRIFPVESPGGLFAGLFSGGGVGRELPETSLRLLVTDLVQQWPNLIIPRKGPIHISPAIRFINPMFREDKTLRPELPFTGVSGPSGPEIAKKVSKRVFLGVWRKVSKNTRKSLKIPIFRPFWVFFRYFRLLRVSFLRFRARRARRLL